MKLCVALDLSTQNENLKLAQEISNYNVWLKVGLRSYLRDGKPFLKTLKDINSEFKIFLDLKLHDIPNTMADAAEVIADLDVDMFNIHASAGEEAMRRVMGRINAHANSPLVLAVTALTSFNKDGFKAVYSDTIENRATQFAINAYSAGLHGVVSSVFESAIIKKNTSEKFITLTPGIRPFNESADDQRRVATLEIAKKERSDFIVVGRPIYQAREPANVVKKILEVIN